MFWADRTNKVAGIALVLLTVLIVMNVVFVMTAVGVADQTARGDIEGLLRDIRDHQASYFFGTACSVAVDAVVVEAAGAMLYLVLRDRSRTLALLGFVGFLVAGIAFLAADAANLTLGLLAADFVEKGGAGSIPAGDPVILQSARAVGIFGGVLEPIGSTAIAFGFLAFGALLIRAPQGTVNPPRLLGALSVIAGLALLLGWTRAANADVGDVIATVGYVGGPLWFLILGAWLLNQPERQPEPAQARRAPATA
jgi:Domain of unknown function (DUF4386)